MDEINNISAEIRERFNSLPPVVQESILQSGAKFRSVKELDDIAADIIKGSDEK